MGEGADESGAGTSSTRPAAVSAAVSRRETTGWGPRVSDGGERWADGRGVVTCCAGDGAGWAGWPAQLG